MLVRSWNLFHGNAVPPARSAHLEEAVRLASEDRPSVLLLQEVPVWALDQLESWSGMTVVGDVARRSMLGPLPIPAGLGRSLTSLHTGLLRSAFSGQANAILLDRTLPAEQHELLTLNPFRFRRAVARELGLGPTRRLAWAKERRICSLVRAGPRLLVANLHATSFPRDHRVPAAEVERAARFVEEHARLDDVVVLGGDFNIAGEDAARTGWSPPGPGIDHLLIRGVRPSALRVWPDDRRRAAGILLSDHAPIELDV